MARKAKGSAAAALQVLTDAGLTRAWMIFADTERWVAGAPAQPREETTIFDIVGRLVRFGSISDAQLGYLGKLIVAIDGRAEREAQRAAEKAAAANCPAGRIEVEGEIVTIKESYGNFGLSVKMLVKHASGYKVWGTVPSNLRDMPVGDQILGRGDRVAFTATVEPSNDDSKFGFFSRPANARRVAAAAINETTAAVKLTPYDEYHNTDLGAMCN